MTTVVEPREQAVEARGLRFHYVEWGEADAPPVVLLHGMSSTCRIWDAFARAFQDRYRLIALDQRGHADSSWPAEPDYATEDYVGDLEELVDLWRLERFVLIGLSLGALNAMAYAARHRERVTHLVSVDMRPSVNPEKRPMREYEQHIAEHGHPTYASPDEPFTLIRLNNQTIPDEALRHRLRHLLKRLPDGRWVEKTDPRVGYCWRPGNLWEELPKIDMPTLIVRGGKSQVLPVDVAERMRAAFPRAELVAVEEAGHTVPEDTPEEFIDLVASFLARYPG